LQDFLLCSFKKEPSERATASQLLNHPWVKSNAAIGTGLRELSLREAQSTIRIHNGGGSDRESGSSSGSGSSTNGRSGPSRCSITSIDWGASTNDEGGDDDEEWNRPPKSARVQDISSRFEDLAYKESVAYVVLITGFETRKNKLMSYTVFRLKVCLGKETWRVFKTYTDFKDVHTQLKARMKKSKRKVYMPKLPSSKMFGADKEDFVKRRKQKLQGYISEILKIPEIMKTGILTEFLRKNGADAMSLGYQEEVEEPVERRPSVRPKEKKQRPIAERESSEWKVDDQTTNNKGVGTLSSA